MDELSDDEKQKLANVKFRHDSYENMVNAVWERVRHCKHEDITHCISMRAYICNYCGAMLTDAEIHKRYG